MPCLFCSIVAGDIPCQKIYEDDATIAFLDIGPVSEGHTLVLPKTHSENLRAGSAYDAESAMSAVYKIAPSIMKAVDADGYNLGMNHGECAGQDVMHTHLHIMPRKNGVARSFVKTHPSQADLAVVAEKIRDVMRKMD